MGVMCLILDKERRYHSLLADIFNITGHKLLVAFDEGKVKELLKISNPEIIILPRQDLDFWLELLKEGAYLYPFVLVKDYEEGESLITYGLGEENFIVLPFNPLELLSKIVGLSKNPSKGFNALLKLMRDSLSAVVKYYHQEGVCDVYVSKGVVKGSTCDPKVLREAIAEGKAPEMEPYYDMGSEVKHLFKNNSDFITLLFEREQIPQILPVEVSRLWESPSYVKEIDLSKPVELAPNLYWVGHAKEESLFQRNSYLCIYEKGNIKVPVL
ncbi:MAG: DNA-binding response regulator, partial [Aquificota bacterium]